MSNFDIKNSWKARSFMKTNTKVIISLGFVCGILSLICIAQATFIHNPGLSSWFSCLCPARKTHIAINDALGKNNVYPLVIIGSGPAGLSAAVYGARQKIKTLVIEGGKPGGLLTETSYVENMPGFKSILGKDLINEIKEQALHFGATFINDIVEKVDVCHWPYSIETEDGKKIYALSIIVSTGASPRKLGIVGEDDYWGKGVTTCAICDAPFYKGKDVVVIGGGDSAVEEAMQLAPYAKQVTILVRKPTMRATASMQELLKGYANIAIRYNVEPKKIVGNDEQVTGIELLDSNSNQTEIMPIDGVFLAIGHLPNTALFKETLDLDANGYITLKGRSQETSVQGVFAAGDVEDHRYRQAGVAAGSGIKAALDVGAFLNEIGFNDAFAAQLQTTLAKSSSESHSSAGSLVKKVQTIDEFDTAMAAAKTPLFVDFYADYCPSCMQMLPHFDAVSQEYKNLATFVSVDIDKLPEVSKKYFVTKIPALLVFKEGKLVARYNSALTKRELQDLAAQIVAESPAE